MCIKPFPDIKINFDKEDKNPAIQLFGRRFEKDQTEIEYLVEFLLVFISKKSVNGISKDHGKGFLDLKTIDQWAAKGKELIYSPPAKLNLKLFSFLSTSKLETRHSAHISHYQELRTLLSKKIKTTSSENKSYFINLFEQLLVGFVGIAQNRTWSAHTFLPISEKFIAGEAIWKVSKGNKNPDLTWDDAINYFSLSQHIFMARGGELLYLQICNLFSVRDTSEIINLSKSINYSISIETLKEQIEEGLYSLLHSIPTLGELADWIERIDLSTSEKIDSRDVACGWCPKETWKESYFFAIEMANVCNLIIDPLEKIELLKFCCVFQVLRTLCAQGARYWEGKNEDLDKLCDVNGFAWIVTDRNSKDKSLKDAGKRNLIRNQEMIHSALRNSGINPPNNGYKNADEQGQSLFLKLSKKIEFVVPLTGPGARFVMNENLLRFFVLSLIPPGRRWTLSTFKKRLYLHFGIAISGVELEKAVKWSYPDRAFALGGNDHDKWFEDKLRATGLLIPLSDAISLVHNPFGRTN